MGGHNSKNNSKEIRDCSKDPHQKEKGPCESPSPSQSPCMGNPEDHQKHLGADFTYFKDGKDWPKQLHLHTGKHQSPIDMSSIQLADPHFSIRLSFPDKIIKTKASYTHNTFKALAHETIGKIILENTKNEKQIYLSKSLHFHAKSEHTIGGVQYDAELHCVFEAEEQKAFSDKYCVVGILFKIDENHAIDNSRRLINDFKPASDEELEINYFETFQHVERFPIFYHYQGSLTTPPCTETVMWFVYSEPVSVKKEDLKIFFEKWIDNKEFSGGHGNCRKTQGVNDRKIYKINAEIIDH